MSGSSRSALRQGIVERQRVRTDFALVDQAFLALVHELDRVLDRKDVANSFSLMSLTIAASVVDLPDPVGPVTSTTPRGYCAISLKMFGAFSSSSVSTFDGMVRITGRRRGSARKR